MLLLLLRLERRPLMVLLLLLVVVLAQRWTVLVRGMPGCRGTIARSDFVGATQSRSGHGRRRGDAMAEQFGPGRGLHGSGRQLGPFVGARWVAPVRQSHSFSRRRAWSRRARVAPVVERAGRLRWRTSVAVEKQSLVPASATLSVVRREGAVDHGSRQQLRQSSCRRSIGYSTADDHNN